jgi:hypothetical protein
MMSRFKTTTTALMAVVAFASIGLAAYSVQADQIMAAADGMPDSAGVGAKTCGANCPDGWFQVGTCQNAQTCCGWVKCSEGGNSGQNTCCNTGETCSDGRQCLPPCAPVCA